MMAALAGACIGFLPYNFNPAKIFMGDTGSTFLGFIMATVSVEGFSVFNGTNSRMAVIKPKKIASPPIQFLLNNLSKIMASQDIWTVLLALGLAAAVSLAATQCGCPP